MINAMNELAEMTHDLGLITMVSLMFLTVSRLNEDVWSGYKLLSIPSTIQPDVTLLVHNHQTSSRHVIYILRRYHFTAATDGKGVWAD
jgi:hypothetical protein